MIAGFAPHRHHFAECAHAAVLRAEPRQRRFHRRGESGGVGRAVAQQRVQRACAIHLHPAAFREQRVRIETASVQARTQRFEMCMRGDGREGFAGAQCIGGVVGEFGEEELLVVVEPHDVIRAGARGLFDFGIHGFVHRVARTARRVSA